MSKNYNQTLQTNNSSLEEIIEQLNNMPDAGGAAEPTLQDKTVTPTTSKQTVIADEGYDGLDTVTVNAIPSNYITTDDATASAGDILNGKTAYVDGKKITGNIATKTSSNLTASGATVTVPAGYYASNATKSVSTATQATPSITINTSGLITATATQTAGYVAAGTKSATKQLAFQAAQTITPGTTDKTIAAGTYIGGTQTIKGDVNLVAANIVSGKTIFGVAGTATAGGSGGNTDIEDALITKTITSYTNDRVTTICNYAFLTCSSLTSVNFPNVTSIGYSAFANCPNLTSVSFPNVTSISINAFNGCYGLASVSFPKAITINTGAFLYCENLTSVSFPNVTSIGYSTFYGCTKLTSVSFPNATTIGYYAFRSCSSLTSIYLGASTVCKLSNSDAFSNTGIWSDKGSIFVPASLLASYKAATNWAYFANRIFSYAF